MMAASTDPFTQVHAALWALLEGHAPLAALVKPGNRRKLTGDDRAADKDEYMDADLPELRLVPAGHRVHLYSTSSGHTIHQQYNVELSTGDQRLDTQSSPAGINPVKWEIIRALTKAAPFVTGNNGKWLGLRFVRAIKPGTAIEGVAKAAERTDIQGWALALSLVVELEFAITQVAQDDWTPEP
jgi:hypothetical protein